jgi:hypothetical protein
MSDRKRMPALPLWALLAVGVVLVAGSQMRFGIGLLAWFAWIPWLLFLRSATGWRHRVLFVVALFLAWTLSIAEIATEPIPLIMAPVFAAPIALAGNPAPTPAQRWLPR